MSRFATVFMLTVTVVLAAHPTLAASYAVGTCKPTLPSFANISTAVSSVPPSSTVLVCPGTYPEQVTISQPLTLQGITSANSAQAVIAPPADGLVTNTTGQNGATLAVQLWVKHVTGGSVDISTITIDGMGQAVTGAMTVGVYYQNSGGTANRVTIRNQNGHSTGVGFWAGADVATPTVTIQNSSVHDTDAYGITVWGATATIKANDVSAGSAGIYLAQGSNATVSGNFVTAVNGIFNGTGATGTVSGNTVANVSIGIDVGGDGVSVISNKIFNSATGVVSSSQVAAIQNNSITNSSFSGIEFDCQYNPNVIHNTINDAQIGVHSVPAGLAVPNTFLNVATIRTGCP